MTTSKTKSDSVNWRLPDQKKRTSFQFEDIDKSEFSCVLPASANWYCSSIISCLNGYCAVGCKNAVSVVNLQKNPPVFEWDICASTSISTKVTAVALISAVGSSDNANPDYVAVGMEDGLTRIFSYSEKKIYKEHRKHMSKVTAIAWSQISPGSLWSADDKGNLSNCNYEEHSMNVWVPLQVQVVAMELCDVDHLIVIGYINGNIVVGDTNKMEVIKTYKSHIDEVCSLSWCPYTTHGTIPQFVSGAKDRTLRIWDITLDKPTATYSVPRKLGGSKNNDATRGKTFHAVLWIDEHQILSGYPSGEILCWDIRNGNRHVLKNAHNRLIFQMSRDVLTNQFVSVSMDRMIRIWNIQSLKQVHGIPSFGGFVYSLSSTPLDPSTIAVGVGDNIVRTWSTNDPKNRYESTNFWQGIKTKVLVVSFHPCKEGIVGIGTDDGHVLCTNVLSHKYDVSASYHKKSVYSLSWGPSYNNTEENNDENYRINSLYSVGGEGSILMHKLGSFNQDAINITKIIKKHNERKVVHHRSELCWRTDYKFVAVGNEDGTIDIFKPPGFLHVCYVNIHKKIINCLAWHHDFGATDGGDEYTCWLASGSDEDSVCVHNLHDALLKTTDEYNVSVVSNVFRKFSNHSGRITRVVWSPHKNGLLASSSYDGSVQIWDVINDCPIANFRGHIGRVQCVLWSYNDSDIVYSGGEDFTLRRWKISEQTHVTPPTAKKNKSKKKKKGNTSVNNSGNVTPVQDASSSVPAKEPLKESLSINDTVPDLKIISAEHKDEKKRRRGKSLFKTSAVSDSKKKELKQIDSINLAQYLQEKSLGKTTESIQPGADEHSNLGFYGTRKDIFQLVNTECDAHKHGSAFEQLMQLEVWRNNIGGLLDEAHKEKSITDTMVALSPLGGYDMWKATCLAYAEQLESKRNFTQASLYYLAIGDVYKAVDVFQTNAMYREAITLAKLQLTSTDPLINEIYMKWAAKLTDEHSYENAAECYLAAGYIEDAVTILAKRADSSSLLTAIKVADIHTLENRSAEYLAPCIKLLLEEHTWDVCHDLLSRYPTINLFHMQAVVGEMVAHYMIGSDLVLSANTNHVTHRHYEKSKKDFSDTFLNVTLSTLKNDLHITEHSVKNFEFLSPQSINILIGDQRRGGISPNQVFHRISNFILAGIVGLLSHDLKYAFKAWLQAFDFLVITGNHLSLVRLFQVLFPRNNSFDSLLRKFKGHNQDDIRSVYTNFLAYSNLGTLYFTWWDCGNKDDRLDKSELPCTQSGHCGTITTSETECSHHNPPMTEETFSCNSGIIYERFSIIAFSAWTLLSQSHARYFHLRKKLAKVEEKLLEIDIKKRLKQHLLKEENTKPKIETINVVQHCLDDIVTKVTDYFRDDDLHDTCNTNDTMSNMEILKQKLTNELLDIPDFIKDYCFPGPEETILVLLTFAIQLVRNKADERAKGLIKEIRRWGVSNGCYVGEGYAERVLCKYMTF